MKAKKVLSVLLIALTGSLIGVVAFSLIVKPKTIIVQSEPAPPTHLASFEGGALPTADFRLAASRSVNAVVHVVTTTFYKQYGFRSMRDFFLNNPIEKEVPRTGSGSGVIVSPDGHIVTNNHVIAESDEIEVTLYDGRVLEAELVGRDPGTDVAVIKIKADDLPYLPFGNSDDMQVGDWVLAVGSPWGILKSTVTAGIISARGRYVGLIGSQDRYKKNEIPVPSIESFIQTDAAVNRGNSGGALVNLHGEMIGMNTGIASPTGAYSGYSFAIPSIIVKKVVDDLIEYGEVHRAALGVTISSVDAALADSMKLDVNQGSLVNDLVKDGASQKAGLEIGDVITEIEGRKIRSNTDLMEKIAGFGPGDIVHVVVDRDGDEKSFKVKLDNLDQDSQTIKSSKLDDYLGVRMESLDEKDLDKYDIRSGVKVSEVTGGKFDEAGVPEGFIITKVGEYRVRSPREVRTVIEQFEDGKVIVVEGLTPKGREVYFTFRK